MVAAPTQVFDLYYVMVEILFGNMLASAAGFVFILLVIAFLTKTSPFVWGFIISLFIAVFLTGYYGGIWAAMIFVAAVVYAGISVWVLINKART